MGENREEERSVQQQDDNQQGDPGQQIANNLPAGVDRNEAMRPINEDSDQDDDEQPAGGGADEDTDEDTDDADEEEEGGDTESSEGEDEQEGDAGEGETRKGRRRLRRKTPEEKEQAKQQKARKKTEKKEAKKQKKEAKEEAKAAKKKEQLEKATDAINGAALAIMEKQGFSKERWNEIAQDPGRPFDTLADLASPNGLDGVKDEGTSDNAELKQVRKKLVAVRKGNLYRAVIHLRMLKAGQNPAALAEGLKKKDGANLNRFKRFVNASDFDKAGEIGKYTGAGQGIASLIDPTFKDSKIGSLITVVTSFIKVVNSVRGIIKKIIEFKKNDSHRKRAFAIIGIITDLATGVAQAASMAKAIATMSGHAKGVTAKVAGHISTFVGLGSQVGSLVGLADKLNLMDEGKKKLKAARNQLLPGVWNVLEHLGGDKVKKLQKKRDAVSAAEDKTEAAREKANKKREKAASKKPRKRLIKRKNKETQQNAVQEEIKVAPKLPVPEKEDVLSAMEKPEIADGQRTLLASYLGLQRKIAGMRLNLANASIGAITLAMGMGASISGAVAGYGPKANQMDSLKGATILGGMANSTTIASGIGMHYAKKNVNKPLDERESGLMKEGFFKPIDNLSEKDDNGLRRVALALETKKEKVQGEDGVEQEREVDPSAETIASAKKVVGAYEGAQGQLALGGVNFENVFKANTIEKFKDMLVAGI